MFYECLLETTSAFLYIVVVIRSEVVNSLFLIIVINDGASVKIMELLEDD